MCLAFITTGKAETVNDLHQSDVLTYLSAADRPPVAEAAV
jgi:hypothetical protein